MYFGGVCSPPDGLGTSLINDFAELKDNSANLEKLLKEEIEIIEAEVRLG